MAEQGYRTGLIVGVGSGVSASVAKAFNKAGIKVALAARRAANLADLAKETGALAVACDATDRDQVAKLFAQLDQAIGGPDIVIYNASYRTRGPFATLDPAEVEKSIAVSAFGGFLVAQEAVRRMLPRGRHYAFEFRHKSWYAKPVFDLLRAHDVSLCISDHHDAPSPWEVTAGHVYWRGHGPGGAYKDNYSDAQLRELAAAIRKWRRGRRIVYAYFDNDQKSAAPKDAARLMRMLG